MPLPLPPQVELGPTFCDITWGAGGSTADLTLDIASRMQNEARGGRGRGGGGRWFGRARRATWALWVLPTAWPGAKQVGMETMMHLTCTNMPEEKLEQALAKVRGGRCSAWGRPGACLSGPPGALLPSPSQPAGLGSKAAPAAGGWVGSSGARRARAGRARVHTLLFTCCAPPLRLCSARRQASATSWRCAATLRMARTRSPRWWWWCVCVWAGGGGQCGAH